jgi:hypothetical protein
MLTHVQKSARQERESTGLWTFKYNCLMYILKKLRGYRMDNLIFHTDSLAGSQIEMCLPKKVVEFVDCSPAI